MSYKIYKTDGSLLTEIVDSAIDQTASDLTLIGKNVAGYGQIVNENFVKLLENFANTSAPNNPITGQIWFDTAENRLKVYDGNGFRIGSGPIVTGIPPTNLVQGDIWIDSAENQMHFYDGVDLLLAGPVYKSSQGLSGFTTESIYDSNNALRTILILWVGEILIGIFSKYTFEFEPREAISGFSGTIKPGFNGGTLSGMKFNVTAKAADALKDTNGNSYVPSDFMSSTAPNSVAETITIQNVKPFILGPNQNFEVTADLTAFTITSNNSNQDFKIRLKNINGMRDAITIKSGTQRVGIYNSNPTYTLDVAGSFRAEFGFTLPSYTTTARDAKTSANGELIYNSTTDKVQAFANGIWVDLH